MFCADCGKSNPEGARFCQDCGAWLPAGEPGAAGAPPPPPPPAALPGAAYHQNPPPAPPYEPQSPAFPPPRRGPGGLLPGIIAAVIVLLAGLGVGLFFGLKDGAGTEAASTSVTTATASPTTTGAPATTTTTAPVTTSLATTSTEATTTTTTESEETVLGARVTEWFHLLESIPTAGRDLTAEIAAFLTPKEKAQERAAALQDMWLDPGDPGDIIETDRLRGIARATIDPGGSRAVVVNALDLICRDGLTTRGLLALDWTKVDGRWLRNVSYQPSTPVEGPLVSVGETVVAGYLLCAPLTVHELKHLSSDGGPTASGMFLAVQFFMRNESQTEDITPGGWRISAIDTSGKSYDLSAKADDWWYGDVEDRAVPLMPGESTFLWHTFEVPEGLDLENLRYQVLPPQL